MMKQRPVGTVAEAQAELALLGEPDRVPELRRYFRCDPGGYGEGDDFRGVRVPNVRVVARRARDLSIVALGDLLRSRFHEDRLLAAILLVHRYQKSTAEVERYRVRTAYLHFRAGINNWDIVDVSAPGVIGEWTRDNGNGLLHSLAASPNMWDRRIAMISTLSHIRHGVVDSTLEVADVLLSDRNELIEKATGWMLREAWKREPSQIEAFLVRHRSRISSTTRRYATELMTATHRERIRHGDPITE
jgi:3-methyladenine DNA glycosylase AlkD